MESVRMGGVQVNVFAPLWELEQGALNQIGAASQHPFAVGPVAVMPDCHQGYGVTIGTVLMTNGVIIPNAVGVDIGCGVTFVNTGRNFYETTDSMWRAIENDVRLKIPVGFNWYDDPYLYEGELIKNKHLEYSRHPDRVFRQFGTLGGGNHFLEYLVDEQTGMIWAAVHSGSRGFGHDIAMHFANVAVENNVGGSKDLESLAIVSNEGKEYLSYLEVATKYASESRKHMLSSLRYILRSHTYGNLPSKEMVDVPHNYAEVQSGMVLHRKGAVSARAGQVGIIPGSMGTSTYVTEGKGNPFSQFSSSHGAGRRMSRSQAKKNISLADFSESLSGTYSSATAGTIDESPQAYKDIDTVISQQEDCVSIKHVLKPILTIKGGGRDEG